MAKKKTVTIESDIDLSDLQEQARSDAIEIAAETLTGDMRDFILDRLRHEASKRPWHERSEADQRDAVHQVEAACGDLVRRCVEIIAAQGLRTIKATLEKVTIKDGIKGEITCSKFDEARHLLCDAQGKTVLVVVADPDEFTGERAPVAIKPDQATLLGEEAMVQHADDGTDMASRVTRMRSPTDSEAPFH